MRESKQTGRDVQTRGKTDCTCTTISLIKICAHELNQSELLCKLLG